MMELWKLPQEFTVCKVADLSRVDFTREFVFLSKTDDESSLVCESAYVPQNVIAAEPDWRGLKISGVLDFGLIGVIAKIAAILAEAEISIFVVSTYNTDYVFVKAEKFDLCVRVLATHGYEIRD